MQLEQSVQEASYPLRHDIDLHLTVMAVRRLPFIANLSEVDRAMLSTVVSELGSNILKYAERGEITLTLHHPRGRPCIDIVARDQGPGIGTCIRPCRIITAPRAPWAWAYPACAA